MSRGDVADDALPGGNSDELVLTAVCLSQQPGIQVKTVAAALAIHPFMLAKWRNGARDWRLL